MSDDYLQQRLRQKLFGKQPEEKKIYHIPKKSAKKVILERIAKESGQDGLMDKFFEDARKEMTGVCLFCGGKTEKNNDGTFRNSVAHLFAKRKNQFRSIALHPANRIELCFFGNSCHTNFDTNIITFEDIKYTMPKAWEIIIEKSKILYPVMTKEEQNKVPQIILNEINFD